MTIFGTCIFLTTSAQHIPGGFYAGAGLNINNAWEQVESIGDNGKYKFSHSTTSKANGFFTQSLVDYGAGFSVGFRYNFKYNNNKNAVTIDAHGFYNYQELNLESKVDALTVKTIANNNYGYRVAIGHHFGMIHPYIFVAGIMQKVTVNNNLINNGGIVYDVDDDKKILPDQLGTGNTFRTFVGSFLGGFGVEIPLTKYLCMNMDYTPMKHVEYGLKDIGNPNYYFVHNTVINQFQVGIRYFLFDPFRKKQNTTSVIPENSLNN